MSDSSKAFREGMRARRRGLDYKDNPHLMSLPLHDQWYAGWNTEHELLMLVPPGIAIRKVA